MHRIVTDELIPVLHEEPGFAGALNLVDRQTGDAILAIRRAGAKHRSISVWEVMVRV
jgi:hypothetical protein